MKKNLLTVFFSLFLCFIIFEFLGNVLKIRPLLWKNSFYSYLNVGWKVWDGADYLGEVHSKQVNLFGTRGKNIINNDYQNLILIGDSAVETSHKIEEMPENYLRSHFKNTNVLSLGSWGWGNDQQYLMLKRNIKKLKEPKIVLWFQLNDVVDNGTTHGFLGRKPSFEIKKYNNEWSINGPDKNLGKNYLEYSYTYRIINKLLFIYKLKKEKTFIDFSPECKKSKEIYEKDKKEILNYYYNIDRYEKDKKIFENVYKPYRKKNKKNKFVSYEMYKKRNIENFLYYEKKVSYSNGDHSFVDPFKYNRKIISNKEQQNEILTNLLLKKIQKETRINQGKFYLLLFTTNDHQPFPKNKKYFICHNNKEIEYSNLEFEKKLTRLFQGIDKKLILNIEDQKEDYYDLFDGHLNSKANSLLMRELANFINYNK